MKEKNDCLNLWKGIAAFSVIGIHCGFFLGDKGKILSSLARFAVPFFFLVSGYFASGRNWETIRRRAVHILRLLVLGNAVYLLWGLLQGETLASIFAPKSWMMDFLLWNYSPTAPHLWFLGALLYCYLFYGFLLYAGWEKKADFLIPLLLGANLLLGEGRVLLPFTLRVRCIRSFLFTGLPFFLWGRRAAEKESRRFDLLTMGGIVLGGLLAAAEQGLTGYQELHLGNILMAGGIFRLALVRPELGRGSRLSRLGEVLSGSMYLWHLLVRDGIKLIWTQLGLPRGGSIYGILGVALVMAGSVILSETINALKTGQRKGE